MDKVLIFFAVFSSIQLQQSVLGQGAQPFNPQAGCICDPFYHEAVSCTDKQIRFIARDPCPGRSILVRHCSDNCDFSGQSKCGDVLCSNSPNPQPTTTTRRPTTVRRNPSTRPTTTTTTTSTTTTTTTPRPPSTPPPVAPSGCGQWSSWTSCTPRCRGKMSRQRMCNGRQEMESDHCSLDHPATCTKDGETHPPTIMIVGWTMWSEYGVCERDIFNRLTRKRTRTCNHPEIRPCTHGSHTEYIRC